jgi:integral membrane protein
VTTAPIRLLTRVRWLSVLDAVTYVLLVGVAMPLKYAAGMPAAVSVVGMVHGLVWMLFMWQLARARFESDWPTSRLALLAVAALLPIIPFLLDGRVRDWIARS